jgi:hypothetical protein
MDAKQLLQKVPSVKDAEGARQWLEAARECLLKADAEGRLHHVSMGHRHPLSTEERNQLARIEALSLTAKGQPGAMADSDSIATCAQLLLLVREPDKVAMPAASKPEKPDASAK